MAVLVLCFVWSPSNSSTIDTLLVPVLGSPVYNAWTVHRTSFLILLNMKHKPLRERQSKEGMVVWMNAQWQYKVTAPKVQGLNLYYNLDHEWVLHQLDLVARSRRWFHRRRVKNKSR